jgi:addiction module HigA family antidote
MTWQLFPAIDSNLFKGIAPENIRSGSTNSGASVLSGKTRMRALSRLSITIRGENGVMPRKLKPIHPGEILREEFLKPLELTVNKLAVSLKVPQSRMALIVSEKRGITPDTALRLGRYFGNSPEFWMNLQTKHDLDVAIGQEMKQIQQDVKPRTLHAA